MSSPVGYLLNVTPGSLSVYPAMLTYVADRATRVVGQPNPLLTGTVTGFKLGQTIATATEGVLTFSTEASGDPTGALCDRWGRLTRAQLCVPAGAWQRDRIHDHNGRSRRSASRCEADHRNHLSLRPQSGPAGDVRRHCPLMGEVATQDRTSCRSNEPVRLKPNCRTASMSTSATAAAIFEAIGRRRGKA